MKSIKEKGYFLFKIDNGSGWIKKIRREYKQVEFKRKDITQSATLDANQKRLELINPPILREVYKTTPLRELIGEEIEECLKINNRCGYYVYREYSYIEPHLDHIISDCMLLVCLSRKYGAEAEKGGLLRLYLPETINFNRSQHNKRVMTNGRIKEIDLKSGDGFLWLEDTLCMNARQLKRVEVALCVEWAICFVIILTIVYGEISI